MPQPYELWAKEKLNVFLLDRFGQNSLSRKIHIRHVGVSRVLLMRVFSADVEYVAIVHYYCQLPLCHTLMRSVILFSTVQVSLQNLNVPY